MSGLNSILNMGARALQTHQQGVALAGQNMANVNNPAYARQRLSLQTSPTYLSPIGPMGTGVEVAAITSLRDAILDSQIVSEAGVRGSLEAQQNSLQYAQASLGTQIDRLATGAEGAAAAAGVGGTHSLADDLTSLFNSFRSLSANPTSMAERHTLLSQAQGLTSRFNQIDQRLTALQTSLNESVQADVKTANQLMTDIARLNDDIQRTEIAGRGKANDLRDLRQSKLEELGAILKFDAVEADAGVIDITISGTTFVSGKNVLDTLEAYDPGNARLAVRAAGSGSPLLMTSGRLQGTMDVRDGALATLQGDINDLASLLISEVNTLHTPGYGLNGTTGRAFFTGSSAADIAVDSALTGDPGLIQAAGVPGAVGDNQVALALAQLDAKTHATLGGQTFVERYGETVAALGDSLSSVNSRLLDQGTVEEMLLRQREAVSGVSLDEELTNLTIFQQAFAASARLITTVDEMFDTVLSLKR